MIPQARVYGIRYVKLEYETKAKLTALRAVSHLSQLSFAFLRPGVLWHNVSNLVSLTGSSKKYTLYFYSAVSVLLPLSEKSILLMSYLSRKTITNRNLIAIGVCLVLIIILAKHEQVPFLSLLAARTDQKAQKPDIIHYDTLPGPINITSQACPDLSLCHCCSMAPDGHTVCTRDPNPKSAGSANDCPCWQIQPSKTISCTHERIKVDWVIEDEEVYDGPDEEVLANGERLRHIPLPVVPEACRQGFRKECDCWSEWSAGEIYCQDDEGVEMRKR